MYSDGPNKAFGSAQTIANGTVSITIPQNNIQGQDDLSILSIYTYFNGYGENVTVSTGFSQNLHFLAGGNDKSLNVTPGVLPEDNPSGTLDSYSWVEIQTLARAKFTPEQYKAKYGIELGQVVDGKYVLVDWDAYCGFVFMYQYGSSISMNGERTNVGGYASADLARTVNSFYNNLDDDLLKSVIKQVSIKCNDGTANYKVSHNYSCYMFLASHREVGGTMYNNDSTYDPYLDAEGETFDYFTSDFARQTIGGAGNYWWTRTARPDTGRGYYVVNTTGGTHENDNATSTYRVVPAFVVG
jgi:hypothetical protein